MAFIEIEKSARTNDWSMHDLHSHSNYEIYILKSGARSFFLSNALYKVTAPVVIVIPPHVMHKTEGGAFERYNINVSANYLDAYQKDVLDSMALRVVKPKSNAMDELVYVLDELTNVDKHKKYGETIIRTLFSYGVFALSKLEETDLQPKAVANSDVPPLVLKVIDYLNANYHQKQTLDELAKTFFVSKATLIYNFKKYTNCSLIDFLLNLRLTKAKELLLNTKKSLNEISELCGFSSSNYFGLIFKRKENLSPAHYRKHQNSKT